jgi:TonB family protein
MAIGGLIKKKTQEDLQKFPWLADVPVLGKFFKAKTTTSGGGYDKLTDTELFITLTPRIVGEPKQPPKEKQEIESGAKPTSLPAPEVSSDPVAGYTQVIQKRISDNLKYPNSAKEAGFQGVVKLSLKFSYRGELLDAQIKDSSGYEVLDNNALMTARAVSSYPPFPPPIKEKELWIDIPILYQLD